MLSNQTPNEITITQLLAPSRNNEEKMRRYAAATDRALYHVLAARAQADQLVAAGVRLDGETASLFDEALARAELAHREAARQEKLQNLVAWSGIKGALIGGFFAILAAALTVHFTIPQACG